LLYPNLEVADMLAFFRQQQQLVYTRRIHKSKGFFGGFLTVTPGPTFDKPMGDAYCSWSTAVRSIYTTKQQAKQ
jgi:hypothetical protein